MPGLVRLPHSTGAPTETLPCLLSPRPTAFHKGRLQAPPCPRLSGHGDRVCGGLRPGGAVAGGVTGHSRQSPGQGQGDQLWSGGGEYRAHTCRLLRPHPRWTPPRTQRKLPEEPARAPSEPPPGRLPESKVFSVDVLRPGPGLLSLEGVRGGPLSGGRGSGLRRAAPGAHTLAQGPSSSTSSCSVPWAHMPPRTLRPAAPKNNPQETAVSSCQESSP